MTFIVDGKEYRDYHDAVAALGDGPGIPDGLPMQGNTWELFRDGDGNGVLIQYSGATVVHYWHSYYDAVQEIWRWQL